MPNRDPAAIQAEIDQVKSQRAAEAAEANDLIRQADAAKASGNKELADKLYDDATDKFKSIKETYGPKQAELNAELQESQSASTGTEKPSDDQKVVEITGKAESTGELKDLTSVVANNPATAIQAQANNLVSQANGSVKSMIPGVSLPGIGSTDTGSAAVSAKKVTTEDFRVTIVSKINPEDKVVFNVTPQISENRHANYATSDLLHHPGQMQIYKSTGARTWSIQGQFISRTAKEAQDNQNMVNLIRSWVMPYFGTGTEKAERGGSGSSGSRFGAPPDVLKLSAYGKKMIGPVPCVLTAADFTWPNEVQYIQTLETQTPFPIILQVTLNLTESYSAAQYSSFNLAAYKKGNLL